MKIEHESEEKLKQDILKIVRKYLDLNKYKVFFYGSRIRGDSFERSDIDIGVDGLEEISADVILEIQDELNELPILYKIDFVDFKNVSDKFKKESMKFIESLN